MPTEASWKHSLMLPILTPRSLAMSLLQSLPKSTQETFSTCPNCRKKLCIKSISVIMIKQGVYGYVCFGPRYLFGLYNSRLTFGRGWNFADIRDK